MSTPMRIAVVAACPFPSPQGSQVLVAQMCAALARRGHELHLFTYGQGETFALDGVQHHRSRRFPGDDARRSGPTWVKPVLDAALLKKLLAENARRRFDVLHCHNYEAGAIGVAVQALQGSPVVYHPHGMLEEELPCYFRGGVSRRIAAYWGRIFDASVPRSSFQCIAMCRRMRDALVQRGVAPQRVVVIPPAIEDEGPAGSSEDARRRIGVPYERPVLAYCGNLDPYQGLETLLDAVALLVSRSGALLLVVTHATDEWFVQTVRRRRLQEFVRIIEAKTWTEGRRVIEAADAVVLPRPAGMGWPIKLLNYMSLGKPIVASHIGLKALEDQVSALVVPDGDAPALAAAVQRLFDRPELARSLGASARATYLRSFTWDAVAPALENVYARCRRSKALPTVGVAANVGRWET